MKALCISIAFLTLLVGIVGCSKPSITSPESPENEAVSTETPETPTPTPVSTLSLASVVAEVSPAVVRVVTNKGMGSGMIIDKAGYVLTNSHVIEGSQSIRVVFADKREYPASVVGRDEMKDLAILKIVATGLPVATLGNSEKLTPGDEVIAIGYPLDLAGTATISRGVVSAFRNDNEIGLTYIQTDASINPGSSGGALINLAGEVVGINVMTIRVAGGLPIEGMNFAIAINSAKPIIPQLIAGESVLKPTPEPEPWVTYTNSIYGYSIQYPNTWTVWQSKDDPKFANDVYIDGPGGPASSARIGISAPFKTSQNIYSLVDYIITTHQKHYFLYQVFSRTNLTWQGIYPACKWVSLEQGTESYYRFKRINLYIEGKGLIYHITGFTEQWESELISDTIDAIIGSFRLTK